MGISVNSQNIPNGSDNKCVKLGEKAFKAP